MSKGFSSFRGAIVESLIGQGLTLGISAAFLLLSARWLGPANRGVHVLLQSSAQFGAMLLGLGFNGAVPVIVGRDRNTLPWVLRTQWKLGGITLLVSLLALYIGARTAFPVLGGREVVLGVTIVALSVQAVAFNASLAIGDARTPNLLTVCGTALSVIILVIGRVTDTMSVNLVLFAQLIGATTSAALNAEHLHRRSRGYSPHAPGEQLLRAVIRPSLQGYLSNLLALALFRADLFIVEHYGGGFRNAGLYSIAVFAAELILKVPQWASGVLTASVAMESTQGPRRTIGLFVGSMFAATLCILPLAFLQPAVDASLNAVLGKSYQGVALFMLALGPRIIMQAGTVVLAANLAGRGFTWYHPLSSAAGLAAVLALDFALVPRYGPMGAAIASSIGYSAAAGVMLWGFLRLERLSLEEFRLAGAEFVRDLARRRPRRLDAGRVTGV